MVTHVDQISTPPTPADSPAVFEERAAQVWSDLARNVPQMNQQSDEIEAIGRAADAAMRSAQVDSDAALGFRNEANAAKVASQSASAASASAQAASQQAAAEAGESAAQAAGYAGSMAQAIAMAATFTVVPTTFQAACIVVTQPHLRFMCWSSAQNKYVRAPWHQPGVLFHALRPTGNAIQVRADVIYNAADHPDLAEMMGATGATFVLPEGRARVLRSADNGVGVDASLINGSLQTDAMQQVSGSLASLYRAAAVTPTGVMTITQYSSLPAQPGTVGAAQGDNVTIGFDLSKVARTAAETRVKSLVHTLYITR